MNPSINKKICILATNDLTHDPRVRRQIEVLSAEGYYVSILAYSSGADSTVPRIEKGKNYKLFRFDPVMVMNYKPKSLLNTINILSSLIDFFVALYDVVWNIILLIIWIIKFGPYFWLQDRFFPNFSLIKFLGIKKTSKDEKGNVIDETSHKTETPQDSQPRANIFSKIAAYIQNNIYYLKFYHKINQIMAEKGIEFKPDIVHANDLDTLLAGYLIKKATGAKLVYDAHEIWTRMGVPLNKFVLIYFQIIEFILMRKIDVLISVNQSIVNELQKMYLIHLRIPAVVIYNAPNYRKFTLKPLKKHVRVLYQGRYCYDRGLEELTMAARYFKPDISLNFRAMGDENTKGEMLKIIKENHIEDRVKFLDAVPMGEMTKSANGFDIGVISYKPVNINNKLCSPNKLFEYMIAGVALAVSDLPELSMIVKKFKNGFTFNPYDPKSIANAINKIAEDKKLLRLMQKNSLEAAKELNWQEESKKLLEVYENLSK